MGRAGAIACPTCSSTRTKTALGRRAQKTRDLADGGILRAHRCLDCDRLFLSVQKVVTIEADDDVELAG